MRIAVVSDTMGATSPYIAGHGLGRATWQLADSLYTLGHDVTLYGVEGSAFRGQLITLPNSAQTPVEKRGALEVTLAQLVYEHRARYDVIIDNTHQKILPGIFPDLKIINYYHDKWMPARRNAVLCSEGQRAIMPKGFEHAKVVHHQIDPRGFIPSWRHDTSPEYAAFIGFVYKWKYPILAIESAARAKLRLCIAGQYQENTDELFHGGENTVLLGALPPDTRNDLLRGAVVYLQLGHSESFGLTTVEAGLNGCPVVAWPSGGNLDTVQNGVNGVYVDPRNPDRVEAVQLAIHQARNLPRKQCYEYTVQHFGCPERQAQTFVQLAEQVIAGETW